jgi:type II secretory pathway pseudopilin PulG
LIEFIGVLAIIAIMAAALAPTVIKQIDRAVWTQEAGNLTTISNALALQVLRGKSVPSAATWGANAASWLNQPFSAIAANSRNYARAYLIDTNGWLGSVTLPYTQTNFGTTLSSSARLLIVSTIARGLPASISSGAPGNTAFNDIWITPDNSKPNNATWTNWAGTGEDLVVQRINLQSFFHRLILYNRDTNTSCFFSIDGSSLLGVTNGPGGNQADAYYLDGSVVGLYTNSTLQLTEVLNKDMSRIFEAGLWSDQLGSGPSMPISTNLDQIAYAFINSQPPGKSLKGDNTLGAADMMLSYMLAYSSWASIIPPGSNSVTCFWYTGNGSNTKVPQYQIMQSVAACFGGSAFGTCALVQ